MLRLLTRAPATLAVVVAAAALAGPVHAAGAWERFVGEYEGEAISKTFGELRTRDLHVDIDALERGFRVTWTSITRKEGGRRKRKRYTVDFVPSRRDGVFESAMRKDLFGNRVPLDPMQGDPYVWARIDGDTLSVFSLLISDTGSYDMQVYHRTLTEGGLSVRYARFSEGEVLRTVEGVLRRVR